MFSLAVVTLKSEDAQGSVYSESFTTWEAIEMDASDDGDFVIIQNAIVAVSMPTIPSRYKWEDFLPTSKIIRLPQDSDPRWEGQCVGWVKYVTDAPYSGNANLWANHINSQTPTVGSIVVIATGKYWHIGVVVKVEGTTIVVRSRNYQGLWIVSDDTYQTDNAQLVGYIDLKKINN